MEEKTQSAWFTVSNASNYSGLSPALLEGSLIETVSTKRGKFRVVRLLPEWEDQEAATESAPVTSARKKHTSKPTHTDEELITIDHSAVVNIGTAITPDVLSTLRELASNT